MGFKAEILGEDQLYDALDRLTPKMISSLRRGMARATVTLENWIKFMKLSGQVLGTSSNWRLRRSIHSKITETSKGVEGKTGTNVVYAGVHEFGGPVTIPQYVRTVTMAWGRRLANPVQATVKKHTVTYKERSFLRSSYRDKREELVKIFEQAAKEGAKGV